MTTLNVQNILCETLEFVLDDTYKLKQILPMFCSSCLARLGSAFPLGLKYLRTQFSKRQSIYFSCLCLSLFDSSSSNLLFRSTIFLSRKKILP